MSQLRIAITGASGLVGSALIRDWQTEPPELFCLQRPGSPRPSALPPDSQCVAWDPPHGLEQPQLLESMDAVIHLAGRSIDAARWTAAEKQRLRDSRVLATDRLARQLSALARPPRLFLSASAVGYYGECGEQWVDESRGAGSDFLARLAADWEAASQPLAERGTRVVQARLGVVLASHGGALTKMLPLFRRGLGGRLGSGRQYWSWIALEDCCRAVNFLMARQDSGGAYNLVSPQPVTNQDFTAALSTVLGKPALLPAPRLALRLAVGEMADALLLTSCRARPSRLEQAGFQFHQPRLLDCLRQLCEAASVDQA